MVAEIRWPRTVEEFDVWVHLPENSDHHFEFIGGRVIEKMATTHDHGRVTTKLCSYVTMHIETHDLPGYTTGETSGFMIGGERCIPDCAYIPTGQSSGEAYRNVAPTLVIEVISNPDNKYEMADLLDKREIYLAAGATVWEVYYQKRYVDIYTPDGSYAREREKLTLAGLPGLVIPLDRIFRQEDYQLMAHYLVKARPPVDLDELRAELDSGEIQQMRPFGGELHQCLLNARVDADGWAVWEENCYCSPPLKQEREVLDRYFDDLSTVTINKGEGWSQLEDLPSLWEKISPLPDVAPGKGE